jgi:peptidoglycan/xylan/chitin deacetylase (PgdA/CDA1 family)
MNINKKSKYKKSKSLSINPKLILATSFGVITIASYSLINFFYNDNISNTSHLSSNATYSSNTSSKDDDSSFNNLLSSNVTSENSCLSSNILPSVSSQITSTVNSNIVEIDKNIALTFDDGPNKIITPQILNVLKENNCNATFFVLGNLVKNNRNIIEEIYNSGNEIGNHGLNHTSFYKLSINEIKNQIDNTNEYIYNVTKEYPTFIRPPYGCINQDIKNNINCPVALWSIDSKDWSNISKETIINNVLNNVKDGDVLLFHDTKNKTLETIKELIPLLKNKGFQINSLKQLFQKQNSNIDKQKIYTKLTKNK